MPRKRRPTPNADGIRAIIYLRVSKEDGVSKHGLDVQRDACESYVTHHHYEIIAECIDDGISGGVRLDERKGLGKAFQYVQSGDADVILAYNQDRFARKMGVFEEIRERAVAKGVRLETADGRVLTVKEDFVNGDVMALVSAIERRRISERFYASRRLRSRTDGRGSAVVPFGYLKHPTEKYGVVIDPEAQRCIQMLFELRDDGFGYQETAEQLNAAGYHTPRGKPWTPGTILGIERNRALYETGRRGWDGVTSEMEWPVILNREA
jgi:site-specific DNA recombinase